MATASPGCAPLKRKVCGGQRRGERLHAHSVERGDVPLELARGVGGGVSTENALACAPADRVPLRLGQGELIEHVAGGVRDEGCRGHVTDSGYCGPATAMRRAGVQCAGSGSSRSTASRRSSQYVPR
jgi:hypothetical protein